MATRSNTARVLSFPTGNAEGDEMERLAGELPSPDELAVEQDEAAREVLYEDKSAYPRFLVPALDELTGPFAPGELVVIAGREGQGKSVFCLNLFDGLIRQDVTALYIGTEQAPKVLKIKHACFNLGINPRKILKPTLSESGAQDYPEMQQRVDEELKWFMRPDIRRTGIYAPTPHIDRATIAKWVGGGHRKYGIRVAIIDHIDHVKHGAGVNSVAEINDTIRLCLKLATDLDITVVLASQVKRASDQVALCQPPQSTDMAGSSDKERTASLVLGLWRPLRDDMPLKDARAMAAEAKTGSKPEDKIYKPMTMGVKVLKDRLGDAPGRQIHLHVGRGNRLEMDESSTHGIHTNRAIV